MKEIVVNLLFLVKGDQVLLAMKKRGFGVGRYNGVGGKVELAETIEQALIRETQEEINVTPINIEKMADITFNEYFKGEPTIMHVHVFTSDKWSGEPTESEEMAPKWFLKNDIPYSEMWPDDPYWLPQILNSKKLIANFKLDKNDAIIAHSIKIVKKF